MKNLAKIILAATLIITTYNLFAHNDHFRKRDDQGSQYNCPRQHRNGGDGNQQYQGEQYQGEQYQGEKYQDEQYQGNFDNSNCQYQNKNCQYQKQNCGQMQRRGNGKGRGMRKRDGSGPHHGQQTNMNQKQQPVQDKQQETGVQKEQTQN